ADGGPLAVADCYFDAADGVRLHGWHARPLDTQQGSDGAADPADLDRPTLLICHGNAGNIAHRFDQLAFYAGMRANVFLFDYRGYGRSGGRPSERGVYADARAAWD